MIASCLEMLLHPISYIKNTSFVMLDEEQWPLINEKDIPGILKHFPPEPTKEGRWYTSDPRVVMWWPSRKIPEICQWLADHLELHQGGGGGRELGGEDGRWSPPSRRWSPPSSSPCRPPSPSHRVLCWQARRSSHSWNLTCVVCCVSQTVNYPIPMQGQFSNNKNRVK